MYIFNIVKGNKIMKKVPKFLYHYLCILISLAQTVLWIIPFLFLLSPGGENEFLTPLIVVAVLQIPITWLVDGSIRGFVKFKHWKMILFDYVVSPFRVVFEIITVVGLHKGEGGSDYGERGYFFDYDFDSWSSYVMRNAQRIIKDRPLKRRKGVTPGPTMEEINERREKSDRERLAELATILNRDTSNITVSVALLVSVGDSDWSSFDSYTSTGRKITGCYTEISGVTVDGVELLKEYKEDLNGWGSLRNVCCSPLLLSLKPGTHSITVSYRAKVHGLEQPVFGQTCSFSGKETLQVTVTDVNKTVFTALVLTAGYQWHKVKIGGETRATDIRWEHDVKFILTGKSKLDSLVSGWMYHPNRIDLEIYTQVYRDMAARRHTST